MDFRSLRRKPLASLRRCVLDWGRKNFWKSQKNFPDFEVSDLLHPDPMVILKAHG
ncbi:unnamed protein product [Moneuplotes crassus]|uniref:Uncharacterized protein n=1 Tax=Euplotes crassus TaxID=5936 RepID=A0AAD1U8X1_EUPCR|nr:unnamed protein product [Moneuplotes crassus]